MTRLGHSLITALGLSMLACTGSGDDKAAPPGAACAGVEVGEPVLRRLTGAELESSLRDIFPEITGQWLGVRLGPDPQSKLGFSNDAETLQIGSQTAEEILETAEDIANLVTDPATLPTVLPCAESAPDDACAAEFIDTYGLRLFRRPIGDDERAEHLALFSSVAQASDFATGLKWTLVAMIQSPFAVYRSEIGTPRDGRYELSQYEIATALSYTFGGTTPSVALLDKAASGALASEEALLEEARALLQTPGGQAALRRFMNEWIGYGRVRGKAKVDVMNFTPLGDLMIEETERFLDEVLYSRGGGMRELLTAPYTFVNAELSQFYGYGGVSGDFQRVDRPAEWGVGLLAQGSLLAGNAHMDSSSPTQRGLLVYERLLCNEVPPPPANIPPIQAPDPGKTTTRQRYEETHAAGDGCNFCHNQFDPTGFAFEHFDETGRYRADEDGLAIDDSGHIWIAGEAVPVPVAGAQNLAETLASMPEVVTCAGELAATYAYGGAPGAECAIGATLEGLQSEQYGLLEYFARLAATAHMRYRVPRP